MILTDLKNMQRKIVFVLVASSNRRCGACTQAAAPDALLLAVNTHASTTSEGMSEHVSVISSMDAITPALARSTGI